MMFTFTASLGLQLGHQSNVVTSRRAVLGTSGLAAFSTAWPSPALAADADYLKAKAGLQALIDKDPDFGPTMVRLAWHSSGTYDKIAKNGGSQGGTIRFKEELAHGGNAGLDKAVAKMEPIHKKHPGLSYADLYTLGGVVAINNMGGP